VFLADLRAFLFRNFILLREPSPSLSHFDQQSFVSLIHCLASQTKAFGRAPSMVLEFGHRTFRLARQRERRSFAPVKKWRRLKRLSCVALSAGVRNRIARHGGLKSQTIYLSGRELAALFPTCH